VLCRHERRIRRSERFVNIVTRGVSEKRKKTGDVTKHVRDIGQVRSAAALRPAGGVLRSLKRWLPFCFASAHLRPGEKHLSYSTPPES
jgi:hypothetical protein